jgi:CubicO group peptidase (beta-lactamase class C family)
MASQYRFVPDKSEGSLDIVEAQRSGCAERGTYVNVGLTNTHILGEEYDSGGAGIISTVPDYIKLASALANFGLGHNGERILSPASVDLMRTNTLDEKRLESFSWKQHIGYGYGLGVRTLLNKEISGAKSSIGEFGWGGAAGASVFIDPTTKVAAVYAKHTLNPREAYYQPLVRDVLFSCI